MSNLPRKLTAVIVVLIISLNVFTGCGTSKSADDASGSANVVRQDENNSSAATVQSDSDSSTAAAQNESDSSTAAAQSENDSSTAAKNEIDSSSADVQNVTDSSDNALSVSSVSGLATPASSGTLKVIGTQLCSQSGDAAQLRGISTHGLAWFGEYVNNSLFAQLRNEWNVNVVRLAMYTDEYGGYCNGGDKEALKSIVRNGVKYATDNDMYVIIDWHVLNDLNPNKYISEAKAFFAEMSLEYANYNNVLYEICNEPNGGTSWSDIKSYANEIIPIIRGNSKDAIIIVGTPNWSQYVNEAAADRITGYDNIMYALHFYAATHGESLRNTMIEAVSNGLPVFVSEYGICDASGNGQIDEAEADRWVAAMDSLGVSYVAWNLSNKAESSAILSSGCGKLSGITESDLSQSGRWLYRMLIQSR